MEKEKPHQLSFRGRLTVDKAAELHKTLSEARKTSRRIEVDLRDATELDITFVQLLISAHRAGGGEVSLNPEYSEAVGKFLRDAGLCPHAGLCDSQGCDWTGSVWP